MKIGIMRILEIPEKYKKKEHNWYINKINNINSNFIITYNQLKQIISIINDTSESEIINDVRKFLYVCYSLLKNNNFSPQNLNPTPKNGIAFIDPVNGNEYDIYHIHLNEKYVLIWYLQWFEGKGQNIKFIYIEHPKDNYEYILEHIYDDENGFNQIKEEYFTDIKHLLHFSK